MNKQFYLICLTIILGWTSTNAQTYSTNVPTSMPFDSTYVVGQAMIDSFDISQHFQGFSQGQFLLCSNSTFTFKGNQSSTMPSFYLMPGSTLILKDQYFYPTIYMSANTTLNATGGFQNIRCYRDSLTTIVDSALVNWIGDSLYSSMNFTFSAWPNASNPCSLSPNSVNYSEQFQPNIYMNKRVLYYDLLSENLADVYIYDMQGRCLVSEKFKQKGAIDLTKYASGIYLVNIVQQGRMAQKKIFID